MLEEKPLFWKTQGVPARGEGVWEPEKLSLIIPTQDDKPGPGRKTRERGSEDPLQVSQYFVSTEPGPPEIWHPQAGRGGAGWGGSLRLSCPGARPTGKGWGLCLPHGPLGAEEAGRGLGPEVDWPRALRGKRGRGGSFLAGFSFICTASQPVHPALCCQTSLEKAFFC